MEKKKFDFEKDHYEALWKIIILPIITLGIYFFYWEYHTWRFIKKEKQSNISPSWRVLAGVIPMITFTMLFYDILTIISNTKKFIAIICSIIWASLIYIGPEVSLDDFHLNFTIIYYFLSASAPMIVFQYLINQYVIKSKEN